MSTSSEESLCTSEDKDAQQRNSETRANENEEAQKDERRNLPYDLAKNICPSDFKHWPILTLLKPEFTTQICMVMVYGNGGNRAIFVTKDKDVFTLDYHFKTGDTHIGLYPKKVEELCGKNIKTFACNSYFVLALTEEGEVYSWRFNKKHNSDYGLHTPLFMTTPPTQVMDLSNECIVDIACGSDHFLALTSDGKVYTWGENSNKRNHSAQYINNVDTSRPRQLTDYELQGKKIVHIACSSIFSMGVTDKGKLYGWGFYKNEQISIDNTPLIIISISSRLDPTVATCADVQSQMDYMYSREITALSGKAIVKVACGLQHTLALTDEGKLYAWGRNDRGQVGVNNNLKFSTPAMVDIPELVLDIAAYDNLSVAVGSNRIVYVWGDCFGQDIIAPIPTEFSRIQDAFAYSAMRVMHKPLTVSSNNVEEVLNISESLGFGVLETAFDDPSTSDFIVQVEGQPIHVHKAILKIHCQYFKNKFHHDSTNQSVSDSSSVYTVSDKFSYNSYIVYKAFLKYLCTGTVELSSEKVLELMKLADEYCETNLQRECGRIIKQTITTSNVVFLYNKAIECNAMELEEFCFQYALCHMTDVVLSEEYIKLDTSIKDNFMRRAAQEKAFRT